MQPLFLIIAKHDLPCFILFRRISICVHRKIANFIKQCVIVPIPSIREQSIFPFRSCPWFPATILS